MGSTRVATGAGFVGLDPNEAYRLGNRAARWGTSVDDVLAVVSQAEHLSNLRTHAHSLLHDLAGDGRAIARAVRSAVETITSYELTIPAPPVGFGLLGPGSLSPGVSVPGGAWAGGSQSFTGDPASLTDAELAVLVYGWTGSGNEPGYDRLTKELRTRAGSDQGWDSLGQLQVTVFAFAAKATRTAQSPSPLDDVAATISNNLQRDSIPRSDAERIAASSATHWDGGFTGLLVGHTAAITEIATTGVVDVERFEQTARVEGDRAIRLHREALIAAGVSSIELAANLAGRTASDREVADILSYAALHDISTTATARSYFGLDHDDQRTDDTTLQLALAAIAETRVRIDQSVATGEAMARLPRLPALLQQALPPNAELRDNNDDGVPDSTLRPDGSIVSQPPSTGRHPVLSITRRVGDVAREAPAQPIIDEHLRFVEKLKRVQFGSLVDVTLTANAQPLPADSRVTLQMLTEHRRELTRLRQPVFEAGSQLEPVLHNDTDADPWFDSTTEPWDAPVEIDQLRQLLERNANLVAATKGQERLLSSGLEETLRRVLVDSQLLAALAPRAGSGVFQLAESPTQIDFSDRSVDNAAERQLLSLVLGPYQAEIDAIRSDGADGISSRSDLALFVDRFAADPEVPVLVVEAATAALDAGMTDLTLLEALHGGLGAISAVPVPVLSSAAGVADAGLYAAVDHDFDAAGVAVTGAAVGAVNPAAGSAVSLGPTAGRLFGSARDRYALRWGGSWNRGSDDLAEPAAHRRVQAELLREQIALAEAAEPVLATLRETGTLPPYYITKSQAEAHGWRAGKALHRWVPAGAIGGDVFHNHAGGLPIAPERIWFEADIGIEPETKRTSQPGTRLLFSNDGLAFVTTDHYDNFYQVEDWK